MWAVTMLEQHAKLKGSQMIIYFLINDVEGDRRQVCRRMGGGGGGQGGRGMGGRRKRVGSEKRWQEPGEFEKNLATLHNIMLRNSTKWQEALKKGVGNRSKRYRKQKVQNPLSPAHNVTFG